MLCQVLAVGGRLARRHPSRHPRVARLVIVVCVRREGAVGLWHTFLRGRRLSLDGVGGTLCLKAIHAEAAKTTGKNEAYHIQSATQHIGDLSGK